jgi:hypothetical protein
MRKHPLKMAINVRTLFLDQATGVKSVYAIKR